MMLLSIQKKIRGSDSDGVEISDIRIGVSQEQTRFGRGKGHGDIGKNRGFNRYAGK